MNGRIEEGETPEARLAAVVMTVIHRIKEEDRWKLDYADFEEALGPYIHREILQAKLNLLQNLRTSARDRMVQHEKDLFQRLMKVEGEIEQRKGSKPPRKIG